MKKGYLAFDLGAESGRAMLGTLEGGRLTLHELHRFANLPQALPSGLHWNLLELWSNLQIGLAKAAQYARENQIELTSLGVDTWGVDFGLLGRSGQLISLPFAYRDARNAPAMERVLSCVGRERLYKVTGLQLLPFNTIFQLEAQQYCEPEVLAAAQSLAFMPDLLHYFFSGRRSCEATIASTSQMIDPTSGTWGSWARPLLEELHLPTEMLKDLSSPGTKLGPLRPEIADSCSAGGVEVTLPASHDTASAIAAAPADGGNWCYISSGTWSLIGVELDRPLISDQSLQAQFTNERGVDGKIRFLHNVPGMFLVQQLRQDLAQHGQSYDYAQLTQLAAQSRPFAAIINPTDAAFSQPGRMISKMTSMLNATGQSLPAKSGPLVRCVLETLALEYRRTILSLEALLGRTLEVIHVLGGGGRNELLNQMTADATGKTVIAGPFEATATGNVLVQAMGRGELSGLSDIRRIVRQSFPLHTYRPQAGGQSAWDDQYQRYVRLLGR